MTRGTHTTTLVAATIVVALGAIGYQVTGSLAGSQSTLMVAPPAPVAPALSGIPPSLLKRYRSERPQISTPDFISLSVSFCRGQRDLYKLTYERWFETRWEYFDPNGKEFATRATAHDADDDEPLAPLPGGRYSCTEIAASPGAETTPQSDES